MTLYINGSPRHFGDDCPLPAVIATLGLAPETLLVEHNGIALHRHEWEERPLADGDRLEFLRVAAGG